MLNKSDGQIKQPSWLDFSSHQTRPLLGEDFEKQTSMWLGCYFFNFFMLQQFSSVARCHAVWNDTLA